ncbi:btb/poz domain-containing protein 19-like [Gigaspora margarita]|uniref:Btb/poz domain-containing protein 19-like n=1 Tax=Gigaspora margarita TaxID=4874 RepID=A0A8H4AV24_GIGMA|nr:btb/poz domain-containing protein 19-like [Gigaspora margarita]
MAAHEDTQKHKIDDNIMTETFSESISEDYKKLYETKERYDTIITVGKEPNIERIYAHSLILCTRSSYFHRALSDEWAEKKEGCFTLSKPNISTSTFKTILKFLYCGIVELRTQEDEIIELLVAVDELLIQKLNDIIQKFLIKNSCKFLQQSPVKMIHFIIHSKQFNELKEAYLETICRDPKNSTVSRVNHNNSNSAIGCDNSHGPSFGEGPDLHVLDGSRSWKYQAKSYPKILNVDSFMISFYEVFQIVSNITKKSA